MKIPKTAIDKSIAFWYGVIAHNLKWNNGGKINAYGVIVSAPIIDINLSSFYFNDKVKIVIKIQRNVLDKFLHH